MNKKTKKSFETLGTVAIVLVVLKYFVFIDLTWLQILSPLWIPTAIALFVTAIIAHIKGV